MIPFATVRTVAEAIAESVRARRLGLDGDIHPDDHAKPADCDDAARLLGWDRDPASGDMDRPVNANTVAHDLARFS